MQRMSVAMEYGVILKWLKKEGDEIKKGDPVVEIFGEKNEFELEAPEGGILLKILCDVNDEIPISEPIAIIGEKGDKIPDIVPKKLNEQAEQLENVTEEYEANKIKHKRLIQLVTEVTKKSENVKQNIRNKEEKLLELDKRRDDDTFFKKTDGSLFAKIGYAWMF